MTDAKLIDGYITMMEERVFGGWEPYLLTLMFNQVKGNEQTKKRYMLQECEAIYSRFLTRLIKRPHNTDIEQMPFWISCFDWPVNKKAKTALSDILTNDGMHVHAFFMVPPNARTGDRLGDIVARSPKSFLVGKGMSLARLHVEPIEKTAPKAALYTLKQIPRKRLTPADIMVLPRSHSEIY
ncbi:hypothetical protein HRR99_17955 [Agrobacterium vaccinii]|uniref:hypothetical protein n=1 Tax=Agrobacterium vaccinii TaxID=2735528 RepID=UPI001E4DF1F3|nr:hypothetical protein [Agrobacterium vaccinii]UHS63461.1 hypothetical protein HRR99_17955 [Agrobacterium vaccinii]